MENKKTKSGKKLKIFAVLLQLILIIIIIIFFVISLLLLYDTRSRFLEPSDYSRLTFWKIQSIDTMKYSRDLAREKLNDPGFDQVIDDTIKRIAAAGATHAAVGTPYDEEFISVMEKWVGAARKYNLKVWFRGNWSGWEGWFGYAPISREEHIEKTREFIVNHPQIFADGDIFTSCPECENGLWGDPRENGETEAFRNFLIDERSAADEAFAKIHKEVSSNLISMNGDVARLIMDKKTTAALGGVVTIDHYVATPEKLINDIKELILFSEGNIVLGEIGTPIPAINQEMGPREQAVWIKEALSAIAADNRIIGLNYWLGTGGSTELWSGDGVLRPAYYVLQSFYQPKVIRGIVKNELGLPLKGATVSLNSQTVYSDDNGYFAILPVAEENNFITAKSSGYYQNMVKLSEKERFISFSLVRENPGIWYRFRKMTGKINNFLLNFVVLKYNKYETNF